MLNTDYVGKVVYSKSGRDKDRAFIILGIINEDYVYISDGDLRPVEKPKKKKIKHLKFSNIFDNDIKKLLEQGDKINNKTVKRFLQSMNSNEEV